MDRGGRLRIVATKLKLWLVTSRNSNRPIVVDDRTDHPGSAKDVADQNINPTIRRARSLVDSQYARGTNSDFVSPNKIDAWIQIGRPHRRLIVRFPQRLSIGTDRAPPQIINVKMENIRPSGFLTFEFVGSNATSKRTGLTG